MTTTMRETETDGNRETANIFRVAGCLREEVDRLPSGLPNLDPALDNYEGG